MGFPATGTIGLGTFAVRGLRRSPRPPAIKTAYTNTLLIVDNSTQGLIICSASYYGLIVFGCVVQLHFRRDLGSRENARRYRQLGRRFHRPVGG